MTSLSDSVSIIHYHRDMIARHGNHSSYALGWRDKESQTIRFKALAEVADLNHHSVLDAGCGYGDLYYYLKDLYPALGNYCGIEQIPELLDEAQRRCLDAVSTSFISGNFMTRRLPLMDYTLACGSLNYASSDPHFIYKAISRLFDSCTKGLAFNILSHITPNGLLVSYKPEEIRHYCSTLSRKVVIKDDYLDDDFTVFMYH